MKEETYNKKKKEYYTKLNKEVEKLKTLLNQNIIYIDINPIVNNINTYKLLINQLERDYEITSLYDEDK